MIFQATWQLVMDGKKTQTRRLVRPLEFCSGNLGARKEVHAIWIQAKSPIHRPGVFVRAPLVILERMNRLKWAVARGYFADKTYAIQPGRGKSSIGRIKLMAIRQERLQDISAYDAEREGIEVSHYYCDEGTALDPTPIHRCDPVGKFIELWNSIHTRQGEHWRDNPEVWVLEFERVAGQ